MNIKLSLLHSRIPTDIEDHIRQFFCKSFNEKDTLKVAIYNWIADELKTKNSYGHIAYWDVSKITDMSELFKDLKKFNVDISSWDVSNVTNMSSMFYYASSFNQPLSSWDVSKVTYMSGMFYGASSFNQPLSSWVVSKVTNMSGIFQGYSI